MISSTPTAVVTVDGQPVPVTAVSVQSDTAVDLSVPAGRHGAIGGADASFEWEQSQVVTSKAEHPWSPLWRARAGANVEISTGTLEEGVTPAFRGVLDDTPLSLRNPVLRSSCTDPMSNVDATFTTPAIAQYMPPRFGTGTGRARAVGCSTLWVVGEAMEAIGARTGVPQRWRTVYRQTMAGSAYTSHRAGYVDRWSRVAAVDTPYDPPLWTNFRSMSLGRMGCVEPYGEGTTRAWSNPESAWALYHEVDEVEDGDYVVRVAFAAVGSDNRGFGIRVTNTHLQVVTVGTSSTAETVHASIPRAGVTRIMARCASSTLTWRTDASSAVGSVAHGIAPSAVNQTQGRVFVRSSNGPGGQCVGQVDVQRGTLGISNDTDFTTPRTMGFDLGTRWTERNTEAHPPLQDVDAVSWLTAFSQQDQCIMTTSADGKVWWIDPSAWRDLPVSRTFTDDGTGIDLDDLAYKVTRRPQYSRVRVTGFGADTTISLDANDSPNIIANRVMKDVRLSVGDDPEVFFLKPLDDEFWLGDIDTSPRYAGDPVSLPWHQADDFERGRGSWIGGHIIRPPGDPIWAESTHVGTSIEHVDHDTVKVTITPRAGLGSNQYANVPNPMTASMGNSPVKYRPLPRVTVYGRASVSEISDVSPDIPGMDPNLPEYVHDAGWAVTTETQCRQLAGQIADRYTHPGVVEVEVALCAARIGERINVVITGAADLTLDGVVIGIPEMTVTPGDARMRLRVWATSITRDVTTWGEHGALTGGMTWAGHQAANPGTWGAAGPVEAPGEYYGESTINLGGGY